MVSSASKDTGSSLKFSVCLLSNVDAEMSQEDPSFLA